MRDRYLAWTATIVALICLLGPARSELAAMLGSAVPPGTAERPAELLARPQAAFALGAAALAGALLARLALGIVLALAAALPGECGRLAERLSRWITPRLAHRILDVVIGVGVAGGSTALLAGPAIAAPVPAPVLAPREAVTQLWPDLARPGAELQPAAGRAPADPSAMSPSAPDHVTVRPGDCLWSLAADHLRASGAQPDDQQIAAATERWWHANQHVIGEDPGLLRPGQQLNPPA